MQLKAVEEKEQGEREGGSDDRKMKKKRGRERRLSEISLKTQISRFFFGSV